MSGEEFWTIGALLGASGVAFGALGSHWIKKLFNDTNKTKSWEIAAHYQLLHAIPIMMLHAHPSMKLSASLLTTGTILFSGSVYGLVLSPSAGLKKILGPITPIGGLLLIAGWTTLAITKYNQ